jgi:bifunctional UDP-N-acetylglucosamine pyrophosphorylase/glucosamine-1-phosphate N-acetyltransferase
MKENLQAIVLAAGRSTRFNTQQTKLIEKICGQEMILYITKLLSNLNIETTIIVGHQKEIIESLVKKNHPDISFAHQKEQLGTGHAVLCSESTWNKKYILILNGDVPLINENIINSLYQKHIKENAKLTFVTAHNLDPSLNAYGKVIKDGDKIKIVEAKDDTSLDRKDDCCINAGIYLADKDFLQKTIHQLSKSKVTGELYITELINVASDKGFKVETFSVPFDLIRGINTLEELWASEQIKRSELIKYWMQKGIRFASPQNSHIDLNVTIGSGTYIGANVQLYGSTKIGTNCRIEAFSILENAIIEDNVVIQPSSIIKESQIKNNSIIGPFAHIHTNSIVDQFSHIGNFVDIKKSQIGSNTKIKHLSYIGDAQIGNEVNIGAGTITCNYNGITKEKTVIKDSAYIGSHNSLIAPIVIGKNSFTAAGSVITKDVPEDALAIARAHQVNKEEYAKKIKQPQFFAAKKMQKNQESSSKT